MFLKWRLKIRNFFKKYKKIILVVILVFAVVIAINYYLKHHQEPETLNPTYAPHEELLNGDGNPSEKTAHRDCDTPSRARGSSAEKSPCRRSGQSMIESSPAQRDRPP